MKKYIPFGAHKIIEARKAGKKPADMIIVSMCGKLERELNPVVILQEGLEHEWQWVQGLDVCFWCEPKVYDGKQLIDCYACKPKRMMLWNWIAEAGYEVWSAPTEDTVLLPPERRKMRIVRFPWTDGQNKKFALGELLWT